MHATQACMIRGSVRFPSILAPLPLHLTPFYPILTHIYPQPRMSVALDLLEIWVVSGRRSPGSTTKASGSRSAAAGAVLHMRNRPPHCVNCNTCRSLIDRRYISKVPSDWSAAGAPSVRLYLSLAILMTGAQHVGHATDHTAQLQCPRQRRRPVRAPVISTASDR